MCKPRISSSLPISLAFLLSSVSAFASSQARIVRLSDVQGPAQIDKNTGLGFENAFLNLPITQGTQLRTRDTGRVEIEFEDGSTMRLTPDTTVQFSTLGLDDSGKRISVVNLLEGKAYVNWLGKSGDRFTLNFSQEKVELSEPAHIRVGTSASMAEIASFKNDVAVMGPSGTVQVAKKKMVTFAASNEDHATVARNFEEDPYDQWDKEAIEYHDQYSKNNSTPYGYGYSDLNYYGAYSNLPGYGVLWQPYFTGAGWDPFMDGAWSWYPGFGLMFVSAYPWGWMPYYYGSWMFVPGFGWGWQPGGWGGWSSVPHFAGITPVHFHAPVVPASGVRTVVVGRGGPVFNSAASMNMIVKGGTAGLEVPRGSLGNLHQLNSQVAKKGFVEVERAPQFSATSPQGVGLGAREGEGESSGAHSGMTASAGEGHVSSAGSAHVGATAAAAHH
jgi:hypothetical protein